MSKSIKIYNYYKRQIQKGFILLLNLFVFTTVSAQQQAKIFEDYKKDKSTLPDFSYVGYHQGEKEIPNITNYKVFDVTDFGAKPNDDISDKTAIQLAVDAANKNGSGIVFFPKGRFIVNDDSTSTKGIVSKGSRIIFRGSGSGPGGTELFMKEMLVPVNPKQMWTGRTMFTFTANGTDSKIATITQNAKVGDLELELSTADKLEIGDWVALKLLDNTPALVDEELAPTKADPKWKYIIEKGVDVCMYYQVKKIKNGTITLNAPLAYAIDTKYKWSVYKFSNSEEIGVENIAFAGNWKEKFVHHKSWKHDSGFNLFGFSRCTNSWMKNCRFTDCNIAAMVNTSANVTVINCVVTGNAGHEAIGSNHSTNVLLANLKDEASQWHSFGVQHGSVNTVLWNCSYPSTTCFEAHASQPMNSLFDNTTGGFMNGRQGGAVENLPNHLRGLVLWNYAQTNDPVNNFDFSPSDDVWLKMVNPMVVGFTSKGSSFKKGQPGYFESIGQKVEPASLYEAQLKLRLGKLPVWIKEANKSGTFETSSK